MKGERKLSLVKPPPSEGAGSRDEGLGGGELAEGLDLDATPEELREAEALRRSLERGDEAAFDLGASGRASASEGSHPAVELGASGRAGARHVPNPMVETLRAAYRPAPIDGGDLEAILARALGDLDAPPTRIEAAEAERVRVTLEEHDALRAGRLLAGPGSRSALPEDSTAAAAVALRAAWAPSTIGAARNETLLGRAFDRAASKAANEHGTAAGKGAPADAPAPVSLRRFRIGARTIATMTAVVAMAAGVLLMVGQFGTRSAPAPAAAVAQAPAAPVSAAPGDVRQASTRIAARSTQDLFDAATPFPRSGGESARVDRIATARAADLRANRFASWGVR